MRFYFPIVCGLSAVAAIALAIWGVTRLLDNADVASPRNRVQKTYRRTLAEDLRVTEEQHKETPEVDKTPRGIVRRLGISDEFLSSRGMPVRFSGLRISKLSVSRLDDVSFPKGLGSAFMKVGK